ncbi:class I histocompatibility antigen, F10 alpha chain-like isoform X5 [Ammospiza nelsoni]|nr:class I histocompatibility antigen, F10 alpha chain-like isoform X5 [Ammospiza nelsoni]
MAAALGLGLLLGLLGDPGGATKVLHSLHYLEVAVSEPSPGIPQYMDIGFVDGIPFTRYDSERGWAEPLTEWVKDGVDPEYWDRETQIAVRRQHVNARNLETLRERYNQSGGLHTVLRLYGCELLSDGSVRGSFRDGYDGRDFISFDLESGRFVAADNAAEITRRRWEQDGNEVERWTSYLKHVCPEWLQKYVRYGQKELEHKEPPDVHVSGREEHGTLILSCHAYGFYPNTIAVSWMKGGETLDQETEWGGIVPNSDGTFHTWARIEALPEEREQYRCRVEHPGMPEPGIFAWEPTSGGNLTVVVAVSVIAAILILVLIVLIGFSVWKLQSGNTRDGGREGTRIHPAPFWESCATNTDPTLFPQGGGTGMDTTRQLVSSNGGSSSGSPLCGSQDGSWG